MKVVISGESRLRDVRFAFSQYPEYTTPDPGRTGLPAFPTRDVPHFCPEVNGHLLGMHLVRRHSMGPAPMNVDAMRSALADFRSAADERAAELKDSQSALEELSRLYKRLDDSERALANIV